MVKVHLELEGEVTEVFSALRRIVGGAPDVAWSPAGPPTAAAEWIPAETPHRSGGGDSEHFRRVAARSLDGGVGWRLHGGPGTGGPADDAPRVAGRYSGHPSECPVPARGADAGGAALVADAD